MEKHLMALSRSSQFGAPGGMVKRSAAMSHVGGATPKMKTHWGTTPARGRESRS